ncbi:MAG: isochorismatase family protein [Nibricoccus sp.]
MADTFSPFSGALLLCVDLQAVFLKSIADSDRLVKRCKFAIQAAKGFGIPVVFTEQVPQKLGGTIPELLALAPEAKQLGKTTFSALSDDGIRDAIRAMDIEHLIICGLETSICVYQTALDALDAQLQVTILSDAVSARRPDDATVCLDALRARNHVFVLPSETVYYSMLQDVKHPFFKTFTQLVKDHA